MPETKMPLLSVRGLKQYFRVSKTFTVKAVDNISFDIFPGETYGLVGESGSGKSTTGQAVIRLYRPTAGQIMFNGEDISASLSKEQNTMLRTNMQMVFQDPMASLNPYKKIIDTIAMGLDAHFPHMPAKERKERVYAIMEKVGLSKSQANRYPTQFSGGQRQRVGLARALIMNPRLIIADEAISALDVSIQAQVVNLMKDIQKETGTAYLFIAHDLSMVRYISDHIGVMHLGHLVETGRTEEIFENPVHPYTRSLLSAIPRMNPHVERDRRPVEYDPGALHVSYTEGTLHDVTPTHSVLATDPEFAEWTK
jgi:oligopeptide transport system ATP-binding protein